MAIKYYNYCLGEEADSKKEISLRSPENMQKIFGNQIELINHNGGSQDPACYHFNNNITLFVKGDIIGFNFYINYIMGGNEKSIVRAKSELERKLNITLEEIKPKE